MPAPTASPAPPAPARTIAGFVALGCLFLLLVWTAAADKCETMDEGLFIGGGVAQVERGNPNIELSSPPLTRWIAGLSAAWFGGARLHAEPPFLPTGAVVLQGYQLTDVFNWAVGFMHNPDHDHDTVLFWGRFPFAWIAVALAILVFGQVRRSFGPRPAWLATAVFLFLPEVLAHAQWAHSDLCSAATVFLLALALVRAVEQPTLGSDLLLGGAFSLALAVKFTVLFLLPVLVATLLVVPGHPAGTSRWRVAALRIGRLLLLCYLGAWIAYLPEPRGWPPHQIAVYDVAFAFGLTPAGTANYLAHGILEWLPLPDALLKGLLYRGITVHRGQAGFLCGEASSTGWWYYFPVALALKYPTPMLLAAGAGLVALLRHRAIPTVRKFAWTVPPLTMLAAAMAQPIDIGVRNVLFLAPFLALWVGCALAASWRAGRWAATGLAALSILSGLLAWPHLLAYFNPLAGGIGAAHRYLADSNYDWGQDLPGLARELRRRDIPAVRLVYFGSGRPSHWGIEQLDNRRRTPGWYAISRTYLSGMWPPGDPYAWLRAIPPTALVGGSIALLEVRAEDVPAQPPDPAVEVPARVHDGDVWLRLGHPLRTVQAVQEAVRLQPDHPRARWLLARGYQLAGRTSEELGAWRGFLTLRAGVDATSRDYALQRVRALQKH